MYLVKRDRYYLNNSGSHKSFGTLSNNTRIFATLEDAQDEACENEHAVKHPHSN